MNAPHIKFIRLGLITFAILFLASCSKDADLLSDYVIQKDGDLTAIGKLVVDDTYYMARGNQLVLDVLNNDQFTDLNNVTITNTSTPKNGSVVINEDNTLTYIPKSATTGTSGGGDEGTAPANGGEGEEETTDTFEYTAEQTTVNETVSEQGTVTINVGQSKAPTTGANVYFVTTSGNGTNDGKTQSTSWSLSHAFSMAKAGDFVHIKAGNYGGQQLTQNRSGSAGNPIVFIGYKNTPGDIVASQGSTFNYGDLADAEEMPLLDANNTGVGITLSGSHVELQNFQVKDYSKGVQVTGNHVALDNIVVLDMGRQNTSTYDGFGMHIMNSTNSIIKNSYIENATAEAFKIYGGGNNLVSYMEIRADNATSPTDYYLLLTNTSNNIVEDSRVERAPGLSHPGHGLVIKWNAKNNIFRRCETKFTNVEMNFSDVTENIFENIEIIGQGLNSYEAHIHFSNGANRNTVRNINISNVDFAFNFTDMNDGFTPSPDTDAPQAGNNNQIENVTVNNAKMLMRALPGTLVGGDVNAYMRDNIFEGCTFTNYGALANLYMRNEGNAFVNCSFKNGSTGIKAINGIPYRTDILNNFKFTNCTFENAAP